jgi:heat shock protein HtpX
VNPWVVAGTVVAATLATAVASYRYGTGRLLATLNARPLDRTEAPALYRRVETLSDRMDVDPPVVYVAAMPRPNAVAVGGARRGVVVVDRTLFRVLAPAEFDALVAHELAHLESYDGFVQTVAYATLRTVAGVVLLCLSPLVLAVTGLSRAAAWLGGSPGRPPESVFDRALRLVERSVAVLLVLLTLPLLGFSRRRELAADDRAAAVTDPVSLARALRTIERASDPGWGLLSLLYTRGDESSDGRLADLFSTHPSTDRRVERLLARADRESDGRRSIPVR